MAYYEYDYNSYDGGGRRGGFLSRLPIVTKNILIINVFMYLFTSLRPDFMYEAFSLYYPYNPLTGHMSNLFHAWQPITHMFMHGGFTHLFFNMVTFLMFGASLERQWGPKKFLLFYLLTGLGAAALHMCVTGLQLNHYAAMMSLSEFQSYDIRAIASARASINALLGSPMVGASGAIYGILMGFAMLYPDNVIAMIFPPIALKAKWWIVIMFAIELLIGVGGTHDGVAHFAHLGGMLIGWAMIRIWKRQGKMYDYEN